MDRDPRVLNLRPLFAAPRKQKEDQRIEEPWPSDLFHLGVLVTLVCLGICVIKLYWERGESTDK